MSEKEDSVFKSGQTWAGRSLTNYKQVNAELASSKGVAKEFQVAKTLTAAKKILCGYKKKNTR